MSADIKKNNACLLMSADVEKKQMGALRRRGDVPAA